MYLLIRMYNLQANVELTSAKEDIGNDKVF